MTREEAIQILKSKVDGSVDTSYEWAEAVRMAIEALSKTKAGQDCTDFVRWLMDEVMDEENWELNAVANGGVICRKLKKLGLLDVVDGYYVETQETGWIPVSERLPENSGCVLISIAGDIEFGAYDRQNNDWAIWRDGYWDEGKRADAWMPLPEPWKDGEK